MSGKGPALRVAIVGAGPSGLYAAVELLRRDEHAQVELFDRLPTPGGLVRSGVSPDHAARRQVIAAYERIALASGRFRFHGNVQIGRDLSVPELLAHHHAVIQASGASADRRLGIPGEDLPGSHAATEFVAWYNGHPDYADRQFNLDTERAVVIGNGNVALDVARMLLLSPAALARTDVAEHALEALRGSRVREVVILGRRGPAQAAFTAPELLELAHLDDIDVVVEGCDAAAFEAAPRSLRVKLIGEYATQPPRGRARRLVLRFMGSPQELRGENTLQSLRWARNELVADASGQPRAQATVDVTELETGLVLRSVGYRALPPPGLPFDERRGVVPNACGRVLESEGGAAVPGLYVAGWLKRGPSGVIGTNKPCSQETVRALLDDLRDGQLREPSANVEALDALLAQRTPQRVDYAAWKRIDRREIELGKACERPRVKLTRRDALLAAALRS